MTKQFVRNAILNASGIGLTIDVQTSITQQSYVTITAHHTGEGSKLCKYVLDISEMKQIHNSYNLLNHISKRLEDFQLEGVPKVLNLSSTGAADCTSDEEDDGINYLAQDGERPEEAENEKKIHL